MKELDAESSLAHLNRSVHSGSLAGSTPQAIKQSELTYAPNEHPAPGTPDPMPDSGLCRQSSYHSPCHYMSTCIIQTN
jgi:hypothetical protein